MSSCTVGLHGRSGERVRASLCVFRRMHCKADMPFVPLVPHTHSSLGGNAIIVVATWHGMLDRVRLSRGWNMFMDELEFIEAGRDLGGGGVHKSVSFGS